MKTKIIIPLAMLALASISGRAATLGTEFTYQGRLTVGTNAANGNYDLRFYLRDDATAGSPVGTTNTLAPTGVTNGLFTVRLDFGTGIFTGAARWLEIGVRSNGSAAAYTTLSPRQPLTPTPYAIYATNAGAAITAVSANGVAINAVGTSGLQNNAVDSSKIADGTITTSDLGPALLNNTFWKLGGNVGTDPTVNFLGTADNQPLVVVVGGARALRLEPHGASSPGMIGGFLQNSGGGFIGATIAGGGTSASPNLILGNYGFVGAGHGGQAGSFGAVVGGAYNSALEQFSFVGTGEWNTNLGLYAGVVAGVSNFVGAAAETAFIGGGRGNRATNGLSVIGGGFYNTAGGGSSTIGGGYYNLITENGNVGTIGGGDGNQVGGAYATVPGGRFNKALGWFSFAAGAHALAAHNGSMVFSDSTDALSQSAPDFTSTGPDQFCVRASGGMHLSPFTSLNFGTQPRQMLNLWSTAYGIGVQSYNLYFRTDNADGAGSFAWYRGGTHANAAGDSGGGQTLMSLDNTALRVSAGTLDLNKLLTQGNTNAALCLGYVGYNGITESSVIQSVTAGAGSLLQINPLGGGVSVGGGLVVNGVVRASSGGTEAFEVSGAAAGYALDDRFTGAAGRWSMFADHGKLGFYSASAGLRLMAVDSAGNLCATSFAPCSDRNVKQDFAAVDTQAVLEKVAQLPIQTWAFKNDPHTKHVGPMAQDFYAAFGTGSDDKHIATVDADGVALAAIQGLNQKLEETRAENSELKQRLEKLEQLMNHKNGGAK